MQSVSGLTGSQTNPASLVLVLVLGVLALTLALVLVLVDVVVVVEQSSCRTKYTKLLLEDQVLVLVLADDPSLQILVPLPLPTFMAKLAQYEVSSQSLAHSSAVATVMLPPNCFFFEMVNPANGPRYLSLKHVVVVVVPVFVIVAVVVVVVVAVVFVVRVPVVLSAATRSGVVVIIVDVVNTSPLVIGGPRGGAVVISKVETAVAATAHGSIRNAQSATSSVHVLFGGSDGTDDALLH